MRSLCSAIVCFGAALGWSTRATAQDDDFDNPQFPYRAYINADDVHLRSGPGQNYYPVLRLNRGEVVEVYRHDPGGWYAIRPPADCFSWVSADFVEPGEGRMATIKGERVVARVGSAFSDIRDVIQVRLDDGEPIEVIEARRIGSGPAAQTWYKILPPAGEFRWVSGKFIDREPTERAARQRDPNNNLLIARQTHHRSNGDEEQSAVATRRERRNELVESHKGHDEERRSTGWRPRGESRSIASEADEDDYRRDDEVAIPPSRRTASRSPTELPRGDANLLGQLEQIDMDLSTEVAKQPSQWDLRGVRSRTEALLARSDTALDRGRIRLVQRKIARFEDIKSRHEAIASAQLATDLRNQDSLQASLGGAMGVRTDTARFDGIGKLAQVQPSQAGVAGFALVDKEGRVTHYVTAAPGVNLRPYLGQEVAIQGTLGYMPDARTQHVTAKRVSTNDAVRMLR